VEQPKDQAVASGSEDDFDDDDDDDGVLAKASNIKIVDYNWDGKHSDDDDVSDYSSDGEDPEPKMKVLSMEERIRRAQGPSGGAYNPWIEAQFGNLPGKAKGGRGNKDEDEGPRFREEKYKYKLVLQSTCCPGCGNACQTKDEMAPGYLPQDVFQRVQAKRKEMEARYQRAQQKSREATADYEVEMEARKLKDEKGLFDGFSPEEEIEMLVREGIDPLSGMVDVVEGNDEPQPVVEDTEWSEDEEFDSKDDDDDDEADIDEEDDDRMVICQRCHRLKHYGQVSTVVRQN